ncbi:MAG: hypothetical protein ACSHXB_20470 [Sulfitobacter sp.]
MIIYTGRSRSPLPDVDYAFAALTKKGINVSDPHQFRDIGYLPHLSDPEGFQIELLQHRFESNHIAETVDPSFPLGGARFGLITLRTVDIDAAIDLCRNTLGMKQLSVQPVESYAFTLHFFANTDDTPPNADLSAVENREWVYQRPYTILELQHLHDANHMTVTSKDAPGYGGLVLRNSGTEPASDLLGAIQSLP